MLELVVYQQSDGTQPFSAWLEDLDALAAAKVRVALDRMERGNLGDSRSAGGGVMEKRIHWGPGYRIYFGKDGSRLIVLLGGGTKKQQQQDINDAHRCWSDYKRRKNE